MRVKLSMPGSAAEEGAPVAAAGHAEVRRERLSPWPAASASPSPSRCRRHRPAGRKGVDLPLALCRRRRRRRGGYPNGRREGCGRARRPAWGERVGSVADPDGYVIYLGAPKRLTRCGDPSAVSVRQARREDTEAMARVIAALSEEGLIEPPVDLDPRVQWFKDAIEGEGLGARWNSRCGPTSGRPAAGSRSVGAGTSALGPRGHMHPRNDTARGTEAPRAAGEGAWTSSQSRPSQLSREGMERLAEATGPTIADPRSTC